MRSLIITFVALFFFFSPSVSQTPNVPKDVSIEGTIVSMRTKQPLNNELIIFKSSKNTSEYQTISDEHGKFNTKVPTGDKYEVFIMGFKDSSSYTILDIPALTGGAYYKKPFVVNIEHEPAKTFNLSNVEFDFGKATLRSESYATLDELVDYLTRKNTEKAEIGGHTDNVGDVNRNKILSLERAKSITAYLISKGIEPERLTAIGYGSSDPIESNKTEEGRQKNRRIEVKIPE
ncbi:hypothetical protein BH09BAC2_BH09BAC2_07170 [soil metagenome]